MNTDGDGGAWRTVGGGRLGSKSRFRRFRQQGIQAVIQVAQLGEDRVSLPALRETRWSVDGCASRTAGGVTVANRLRHAIYLGIEGEENDTVTDAR